MHADTFAKVRLITLATLLLASASWLVAWAFAEPSYAYDTVQFGLVCALLALLLTAGALSRIPWQLMLCAVLTLGLMAEGFRLLSAPSPFADAWRLAVGVAMTLAMAPLFAAHYQYLLTVVMVWVVMGHGELIRMPGGADQSWSVLLMAATLLLGTVLNLGYVWVLRGSFKLQLELEALAYQDPLTGIDNRRRLLARLSLLHDQGRLPGSIFLMVDVDDFKRINDQFGHERGDEVLRDIGAMLQRVASGHAVGRLGGEEFGVLMLDCDLGTAQALALALLAAAREVHAAPAGATEPLMLSVSIGIALGLPLEQPTGLVRRADQALYRAKHAGKNCFALDCVTDAVVVHKSAAATAAAA